MKKNPLLALAVACAFPLAAAAETSLTVYSSARPGYALVKDDRTFNLQPGRNLIRLTDVPALIDPTTVSFASLADPAGTRVVEQSFEFDLTSRAKLLSKYLDREITVEQNRGTAVEAVTGTLVGTQGGIVLKLPDGGVRVVDQ